MRRLKLAVLVSMLNLGVVCWGQNEQSAELKQALVETLMPIAEVDAQFIDFVRPRIRKLELPDSAEQWSQEAAAIRKQLLDEVVYKGTPRQWRKMSTNVRRLGAIETQFGYRIERMLIEAVPGMWIPALVYVPDGLDGTRVPAVLNVNGHSPDGKAYKDKQFRCIQQAKFGMVAMNIEWLGMGQLRSGGYHHNHLAKLDIQGVAGLSVFYRAMQCGLDALSEHPNVDKDSLAVTGLSGGGWQTILLSSLDTRVKLCVPVAGHSALGQRLDHPGSIGDLEQVPTDLVTVGDYTHLNALMVPRPMLMIYNQKDNCCFVASTVKGNTFDPIVPFYDLAGVKDKLAYYENSDPGDHNYGADNRLQLYRFLNKHFFPFGDREIVETVADQEILTAEQLAIALPDGNEDFDTLAQQFAEGLPLVTNKTLDQLRGQLHQTLRYPGWSASADRFTGPNAVGDYTVRYLKISTGDELAIGATIVQRDNATRTAVLLADNGAVQRTAEICKLADDGYRVLAIDPIMIGQNKPTGRLYQYNLFLHCVGERTLGLQAAQINSVVKMVKRVLDWDAVSVFTYGPRMSLAVRCAVVLADKGQYAEVVTEGELGSFDELIAPAASYDQFPEAYCFGMMRHFDLKTLKLLSKFN